MKKKYIVTLVDQERQELTSLISTGKAAAKKLMRARILLQADVSDGRPALGDEEIAAAVMVGRATVERVRKQFVEDGLEAALNRRPSRRVYKRTLDGDGEARLIALTCSQVPEGRRRWTLQLLADRLVQLAGFGWVWASMRQRAGRRLHGLPPEFVVRHTTGDFHEMHNHSRSHCFFASVLPCLLATGFPRRSRGSTLRLRGGSPGRRFGVCVR